MCATRASAGNTATVLFTSPCPPLPRRFGLTKDQWRVAQLTCPMAVQLLTTPLHLMGLDLYNVPESTMRERLARVRTGSVLFPKPRAFPIMILLTIISHANTQLASIRRSSNGSHVRSVVAWSLDQQGPSGVAPQVVKSFSLFSCLRICICMRICMSTALKLLYRLIMLISTMAEDSTMTHPCTNMISGQRQTPRTWSTSLDHLLHNLRGSRFCARPPLSFMKRR